MWHALKHNKLGELAHRTITSYFKNDPPTSYQVPFSYHNRTEIQRVLKQAGFREIKTEVIAKIGKATRAKDVARGLVEGNPVAVAIAKRDPSLLPVITNAMAAAISRRFGKQNIRAPMRAIVVRACVSESPTQCTKGRHLQPFWLLPPSFAEQITLLATL